MKPALLRHLPCVLAIFSFACVGLGIFLYDSIACTDTAKVALSDRVELVVKQKKDKSVGAYISRCIDVFVDGRRIRRMWCSPMLTSTGASGFDLYLCKGQATEYVAVRDQDAVWIVDIQNPIELRSTFAEQQLPEVKAHYQVIEGTEILPLPNTISNWVDFLNRKRTLLKDKEEPALTSTEL